MLTTLGVIALTGLFAHAVIWNYFAWCRPPQQTGEATVVVLGCKVNGEEPSLMLRRRLECAMEYLAENPQADCVVSGGMGDNESYTEAHVMKKFLVEHGIDAERVYEENRSTSTETNLLYSLALVKEEDLSQNIILCTDGFHQLRAWMYGMRNGVDARAISGRTPVLTIPSYAVRELGGILKMLILIYVHPSGDYTQRGEPDYGKSYPDRPHSGPGKAGCRFGKAVLQPGNYFGSDGWAG